MQRRKWGGRRKNGKGGGRRQRGGGAAVALDRRTARGDVVSIPRRRKGKQSNIEKEEVEVDHCLFLPMHRLTHLPPPPPLPPLPLLIHLVLVLLLPPDSLPPLDLIRRRGRKQIIIRRNIRKRKAANIPHSNIILIRERNDIADPVAGNEGRKEGNNKRSQTK